MSKDVVQTIIVPKSTAHYRERAAAIAQSHASKKLYTSRETTNFFRFRQRPPSDFNSSTYHMQTLKDGTKILLGKLKGGK